MGMSLEERGSLSGGVIRVEMFAGKVGRVGAGGGGGGEGYNGKNVGAFEEEDDDVEEESEGCFGKAEEGGTALAGACAGGEEE